MKKNLTVFVAAGGTGGHIKPGLSMAWKFYHHIYVKKVVWIGSRGCIDDKLLVDTPWEKKRLAKIPFRGGGIIRKLFFPYGLGKSLIRTIYYMIKYKPDLVLTTGGFASLSTGIAACIFGKPLFLLEQNAVAGWSNRLLIRFAERVFTGFDQVKFLANQKCRNLGNPVEECLSKGKTRVKGYPKKGEEFIILVLGGSQGAAYLNNEIPKILATLYNTSHKIKVIHQCGGDDHRATQVHTKYRQLGIKAEVFSFSNDMLNIYTRANIAITRSGALTITELAAYGLPSLYVPLPISVDQHQWYNALMCQKQGAGWIVEEAEMSENPKVLTHKISILMSSQQIYRKMVRASRNSFREEAAERIEEEVMTYIQSMQDERTVK
ncbi:MAG: undecaprenyldiphospho-muramoylpentapeptide beta-N-acetylglucosaminyltransferase [Pseudomonadota bacterium]|nr:undecaprenyldiphospho-muramoylpentapeptide beta-N-acetylglucosaminyltransferase [Pseudomonadota bacterium]